MYGFPEMIDMGLKEGQTWPSEDHKKVATTIGIGNPRVHCRDDLNDVVQAVIKVPQAEIRTIMYPELVDKYGCPEVW